MERDFAAYLAERARAIETKRPLTARELAVVFLVSHGMRYEQIGEVLHVATETARHDYGRAIRTKLGARTMAHAVATALRLGLID
jgi:ATP/maltotriose-dependent transcriptional regulator MalT